MFENSKTPLKNFYKHMKKYNLDNVHKITIVDNHIQVEYLDGTKFTITNPTNVTFEKKLVNENDQPIIDHCI